VEYWVEIWNWSDSSLKKKRIPIKPSHHSSIPPFHYSNTVNYSTSKI